jgi:hypothetical protein
MYQPPAGRLLEFYESDSSVKYDEDTGDEDRVAMPGGPGWWWRCEGAAQDQVGGGEVVSFRCCCCCCFCGQGCRKEEEEEEGSLPSSGGHSIDSDTSLVGGRVGKGGEGG